MTTLRFLFILLAVLNALAFAAIKGWLGSAAPGGEPERITNQLHAEQIRLITPATEETPAPAPSPNEATEPQPGSSPPAEPPGPQAEVAAAVPTETVGARLEPAAAAPPTAPASCVAWAGLSTAEADRLAARLQAGGFKYVRSRKDTPSNWWVRTPAQGGRTQAEKRVRELHEMGITDTFIVQESGPSQFAVSLGLFRTENGAQQLLAQLRAKGAHDASIEPRMTASFRIQASLPRERVAAVEGRRSQLDERRTTCSP
ncbi:MAG: SPOR domain-containing protein [Proteobacteria bacterium]|nr:SPOR domain-containing protein [Pseudomonadota bacterium]MBS0551323.1 SPOR domain-containing protein [Pseudomonadota bacterium]